MAITTSSGDRYDSEENFIANTPSEYIEGPYIEDPKVYYDTVVKDPQFPKFAMTKSGDLENVKPSENIEFHGNSSTDQFKTDIGVLGTLLSEPMQHSGHKLNKDIGLKDVDKRLREGLERTQLRNYGRGILAAENQERFRRDFPDAADEILKNR